MQRLVRGFLVLGLIVLLAQPALGQGQRQRGRGRGQGGQSLLENESVQKELKLDQDQITKVKAAVAAVREKHKDDIAKLQDLSPEERRTKGRELGQTIAKENHEAVKDILKPEQQKRLHQIELQTAGTQAF